MADPKLRTKGLGSVFLEKGAMGCLRLEPCVVGDAKRSDYLLFAAFFSRLMPSAARRFAVRFSAAAMDAFLARAERSSGVMFWADALPPCLPNLRAISVIAARTSGGILTLMASSIYLTG